MSAGTLIATSCKEIWMGKYSSLGPVDPHFGSVSTFAAVEEFDDAQKNLAINPNMIGLYQTFLAKYPIGFIGECRKAIKLSEDLLEEWLSRNMLSSEPNKQSIIDRIKSDLGDHSVSLTHSRHISAFKAKNMGLKILNLEDDATLENKVLSVHHSVTHTLQKTGARKLIENHSGKAFVTMPRVMLKPNF